jgi:hypothetical protein
MSWIFLKLVISYTSELLFLFFSHYLLDSQFMLIDFKSMIGNINSH